MLKQIEGSQAVAEAVALCRPEVICAYPITPQTHIVEKLGRAGEARRARALRVHQRRIRVRRPVGCHRRLGGRCARLHRDRQPGPAVHGRGRLQRLGPRPADRDDDRQPRDRRADQHLERPHRQHVACATAGWIQLFAETNQEALDLHIQAFRLAEELSLPVMVCMDGFILTHAYERVDMPTQAAGRRLPAALRAAPGARPGRAGDRSARWSAPRPSPRCATSRTARQMQALWLIPELAEEFEQQFGRASGGLIHELPHRGCARRWSSRSAR